MSGASTAPPPVRASSRRAALLQEIAAGLSAPQKELPSKLFYDLRGSELFEEITRLPEYYLTRAEGALLVRCMPSWMARVRPATLVELGAGNAEKTRTVLDAMLAHGGTHYVPIDISAEFLQERAAELRRDYPALTVSPGVGDFTTELALPHPLPRPALFAFLGSTIGNFGPSEAVALIGRVAAAMEPGDAFLLGADLRKDVDVLLAAYDDAAGVTAEFNLNVLRVVNREFGADFDVAAFRHEVQYDTRLHRVEMHLRAIRPQRVQVPGAGSFRIAQGETIRTEISCKYDREAVRELFDAAGLRLDAWIDDGQYALALAVPCSRHTAGPRSTKSDP